VNAAFALDPWAIATQPRALTRTDLIDLAAKAVSGYSPEREWTDDDTSPLVSFSTRSHKDGMVELATEVLDAAYPVVSTAAEIEALRASGHAVIVSAEGVEWRRDQHGVEWVRLGKNERLVRASSEQLAINGPWTVVWRGES
jgi:hypothetical protein